MIKFFSVMAMALSVLFLVACGDFFKVESITLKSTVKATYGSHSIEGSAIVRQPFLNSPQGWTRGEATVIDLGGNKRAYMLLLDRGGLHRFYMTVLGDTFATDEEFKKWPEGTTNGDIWLAIPFNQPRLYPHKENHYHSSLRKKFHGYPLLVAFKNEKDPTSIFIIDTEKPTEVFGQKFEFKGLYIERVPDETPTTNVLVDYLPWVSPRHEYWADKGFYYLEASERGALATETSFSQKVTRHAFFSADRKY